MSLYRLVTTQGPLSVPRAAHLFAEVASALEHAHGLGLIHRDLKPSNIMVTPNNHAKVLDLGLAMMEGEVSDDIEVIGGRGYVVGSVDYMAPEQTLDSTQVDGRSDLYALGCALYFALTGKPPFPGGTTKEKLHAHRHQEPDLLRMSSRDVPDRFVDIFRKLLAKKPEDRFPDAGAVRAELLRWSSNETDRPVEKEGDSVQQAAARALQSAPLSPEALKTDQLPVGPAGIAGPILPLDLVEAQEKKELVGIVAGVAAFWTLIVVLLLAVLFLR
jgi:serine/threonine protein kinase